jgi:hypothetical protein
MKALTGYFIASGKSGDLLDNDGKIIMSLLSTENFIERTGGLLRLPPLFKGQGLLINQCNSIHTFGMPYSLDIIYLSYQFRVVKWVENIKPKRMSLSLKGRHTLELRAGEISRLGIKHDMVLILDGKK